MVAKVKNPLATDPVVDRKADPDQRQAFTAGKGVALGVADHQVDAQFGGEVFDIKEVDILVDLRQLVAQPLEGGGDRLAQPATFPTGGTEHRDDPDFGKKGGEPHHQVLFTVDHRPFAEDVLMAVDHRVDQATPGGAVLHRHFPPGEFTEQGKEPVGGADAQRQAGALEGGTMGTLKPAAGSVGRQRRAKFHRRPGSTHRRNRRERCAPGGDQRVVVLGRAIKGIGDIREDRRGKGKVVADRAEVADIRRGDKAGEQVDGLIRRAFFGKRHHCRPHRGMKALHVGAGIAWRRDLDQPGGVGTAILLVVLGKEHRQVVADGLGKAGGGHADQLRSVFAGDVF